MQRAWLWVIVGGATETVWATTMRLSCGFTDVLFDVLTAVFLLISMLFLNRGFRAGLPTGPCYAVWVGIGAVGSVLVGAFLLGEALDPVGWLCIALIVAGVIGLNLASDERA